MLRDARTLKGAPERLRIEELDRLLAEHRANLLAERDSHDYFAPEADVADSSPDT